MPLPSKHQPAVLVVSSDDWTWKQMQRLLAETRCPLRWAKNYQEAAEACIAPSTAVIVSDADLGGHTWRDILALTYAMPRPAYLVVISGLADEKLWLQVLDKGGVNLFAKSALGDDLRRSVEESLADWIHLR
ncbi:MAG: hypothetical protein U0Q16_30685 [Bryobacteraceae bacterium]